MFIKRIVSQVEVLSKLMKLLREISYIFFLLLTKEKKERERNGCVGFRLSNFFNYYCKFVLL